MGHVESPVQQDGDLLPVRCVGHQVAAMEGQVRRVVWPPRSPHGRLQEGLDHLDAQGHVRNERLVGPLERLVLDVLLDQHVFGTPGVGFQGLHLQRQGLRDLRPTLGQELPHLDEVAQLGGVPQVGVRNLHLRQPLRQ